MALIWTLPSTGYRGYFLIKKPDWARILIDPSQSTIRTSFPSADVFRREMESKAFWDRILLPSLDQDLRHLVSNQHRGVRFSLTDISHRGEKRGAIEVLIQSSGERLFDAIFAAYHEWFEYYYIKRGPRRLAELQLLRQQAFDTLQALEANPARPSNFESERAWLVSRIERLAKEADLQTRDLENAPIFPFEPLKPPHQWCFECR